MHLVVNVWHDTQANIWLVESSDIPGLSGQAERLDTLIELIGDCAPDLVRANLPDLISDGTAVALCVQHFLTAQIAPLAVSNEAPSGQA